MAQAWIVGHHEYIIKELRDCRSKFCGFGKRLAIAMSVTDRRVDGRLPLVDLREQRILGRFGERGAVSGGIAVLGARLEVLGDIAHALEEHGELLEIRRRCELWQNFHLDRKSTRLNSSHLGISY